MRRYKDGIYPESDEDIDFIKTEIMKIGLSRGVNLADNNITATLKMIENSTRVRIEDCEPNKDNVIVINNGILNLKTWSWKISVRTKFTFPSSLLIITLMLPNLKNS